MKKLLGVVILGLSLLTLFCGKEAEKTDENVARSTDTQVVSEASRDLKGQRIRVVFLNPADDVKDGEFWWYVCSNFMKAAAADLNIDLKIYNAKRSVPDLNKQAIAAMTGPDKPDFIVMQNLKKSAVSIIKEADKFNVKILMFNSGLSEEETAENGKPREKYKNWIGEILPDDAGAGYDLADIIVKEAKSKKLVNNDGKVEMIALGGVVSDTSAIERNKGLMKYIQENKENVILHRDQALPGNWEEKKANEVFSLAFSTFNNTTTVWNANDNMAIGVLKSTKEKGGKKPGTDIIIGGIDWNPENLEGVKSGEISATIGGHFMEGAWTMVMIYDYANGVDFADSEGVSMKSRMGVITSKNVANFEKNLGDRSFEKIDKVDFKKFSKAMNPGMKKYSFDLDNILKQFK